jgi:hypothetical protein
VSDKKVCNALALYGSDDCGTPAFPVFCERSGGKLSVDRMLCTYHHNLSDWVSDDYLSCLERDYYHYWGCDLVLGTFFPFDEPPTPSMPCADGYQVEIRSNEDGSQYVICVRTGPFEKFTEAWVAGSDKRACSEWNISHRGISCGRDMPMFEDYCTEQKHWGGQLTYQTFGSGQLPVCTFPKFEREGSYWVENSGVVGVRCTERFYYDNAGCLPFDVKGADPPAGATVPFPQSILAALTGLIMLLLL